MTAGGHFFAKVIRAWRQDVRHCHFRRDTGAALPFLIGLGWIPCVVAACFPARLDAQSANVSGAVALSSQLVDRGLAITPATPTLQGAVSWTSIGGWSFGVSASTKIRSSGHIAEEQIQASRYWILSSDWQMQASLLSYNYPGSARSRVFNRTETSVDWMYRDVLTFGLSAVRLIDGKNHRPRGAADVNVNWPLRWNVSVSTGAGVAQSLVARYPASEYGYENTYRYAHAGLTWAQGPWRIGLDRIVTSASARRQWGNLAASPWVATISRSF